MGRKRLMQGSLVQLFSSTSCTPHPDSSPASAMSGWRLQTSQKARALANTQAVPPRMSKPIAERSFSRSIAFLQ